MIFCDTSTVAKLYVPEAKSVAVRQRLGRRKTRGVSPRSRAPK